MPALLIISKFLKVVNLQKQLVTLNLQSISLVALKHLRHNELMQLQENTNKLKVDEKWHLCLLHDSI